MSNIALYNALTKAGVPEEDVERAADNTVSAQDAATKTDIAELKADILKWVVIIAGVMTTAIIGSVGLMVRFLAQLIQGG